MQLRDKTSDTRPMIEAARAIKAALAPLGVPFVVNDRVDVALAARADGVHIGPDDMTPEDARALLGPDAIIGVSIKSVAAAEAAPIGLVDYAGVGGVYTTLSKAQENPPIGTEGLARIASVLRRRAPKVPVVGIAGIDAANAAAVIAAGADGVAVISALSLAPIRPPPRARCAKWSTACWRSAARKSGSARTCESGDPVAAAVTWIPLAGMSMSESRPLSSPAARLTKRSAPAP